MPEDEEHNTSVHPDDDAERSLGRTLVSAFVVACNEEEQIADCLESLSFCDEIVVIDSFSTDKTVEICQRLGAKVIQREWPGYREQKAFGLSSVSHKWVINLDADERISEDLREHILEVLREEYSRSKTPGESQAEQISGYSINRVVYHLGRWWRRGGWYPEYRVRFFRKSKVTWGGIDPHEKPIVEGKVVRLPGEIYHFTYENLADQFRRLETLSSIAAQEEFNRGRKANLYQLFLNPFLRVVKFYFLKRGYREGMAGLVVSVIEGYYTFMKYAKLWEHELTESISAESKKNEGIHGTSK